MNPEATHSAPLSQPTPREPRPRFQPVWLCAAGLALAGAPLRSNAVPQTTAAQVPARTLGGGGGATADSNDRMIAVTGTDITGSSILYLVDTETQQIAVYQASGGSGSGQGIKFVGARRISLDLQLDGYNDRSDYSYKDLHSRFESEGLFAPKEEAETPRRDE